jgi:hypothetical protein
MVFGEECILRIETMDAGVVDILLGNGHRESRLRNSDEPWSALVAESISAWRV